MFNCSLIILVKSLIVRWIEYSADGGEIVLRALSMRSIPTPLGKPSLAVKVWRRNRLKITSLRGVESGNFGGGDRPSSQ